MSSTASKQDLWLAYTPKVCATLSIPSSLFIIHEAIQDHRVGKGTAIQRALVGMSTVDVCASFAWFLSTWAVNSDLSDNPLARGNETSCNFQGFLLQLAIGAPLYNCSLALYYLLVIRYNWTNEQLVKIERFVHSFIILFTLSTSFVGIPLEMYNPTGTVCWVNGSPPNCDLDDTIDCNRGDHAWLFGIFLFYGPLWICVIGTILAMVMIYIQVRRTFGKTRAYLYQDNQQRRQNQQQQNHNHQHNNHYWSTTPSAGGGGGGTSQAAAAIVRASVENNESGYNNNNNNTQNNNEDENDDDDDEEDYDDDENHDSFVVGHVGGVGVGVGGPSTTYENNQVYSIPLDGGHPPSPHNNNHNHHNPEMAPPPHHHHPQTLSSSLGESRYKRLGSVFNIRSSSIASGFSQSFASQQPSEDFNTVTNQSNDGGEGGGGRESGEEECYGSAHLGVVDDDAAANDDFHNNDGAVDSNDTHHQEKDHRIITNPSSTAAAQQTIPTTTTSAGTASNAVNAFETRRRDFHSSSTRTSASNTSDRRRQRRYSKQNMFATQAILYSGSFFITWTPSTIWSIGHWFNFAGFALDYLAAFCEPLQGFWNMLIFIRRRPKSQQKILDVLCFWKLQCFKKAVNSANSSLNSSFRRSSNNNPSNISRHNGSRRGSNSRYLSHHTSVEVMADETSDREFRLPSTCVSSTATPIASNIKRDSLRIHFEDELSSGIMAVVENDYPNDDDAEAGDDTPVSAKIAVDCDDDDDNEKSDTMLCCKNNCVCHDKMVINKNNDDDDTKTRSPESSLSSSTPQTVPSMTNALSKITTAIEEREDGKILIETPDEEKKVPVSSIHFNDSTAKTVAERSL